MGRITGGHGIGRKKPIVDAKPTKLTEDAEFNRLKDRRKAIISSLPSPPPT